MLPRPGLGTESLLGKLESIFEVRDHDHLDGMVFGKVITDSDADFTAFAPINGNEGRFGGVIVEDGVGLGAILGAEATGSFTADSLVDMRDKIQGISPLVRSDGGLLALSGPAVILGILVGGGNNGHVALQKLLFFGKFLFDHIVESGRASGDDKSLSEKAFTDRLFEGFHRGDAED